MPETNHSFHAAFCDDDSAHAALADNNNSVHLVSASNQKNTYAKSAQVQSPCRANYIRCVALNVSGLNAKLRNGVLDQYLSTFDIVSLVETNTDSPVISETLLNSYSCFTMKRSNSTCKYKYGGIHGICVLVSPTYKENVELISDTVSECTLWLKITSNNTAHCILGAMYIPCEKSRFYFDEVFYQIENDILDLKSRFELPFCLFGDFNAHTQLKDDFLEYDDTVAEITGCDLFRESSFVDCQNINPGFTRYRYSQDASDMNRNGKYLLALCQALDFKIVNGRLGSDKYIGRPTCHKSEAASVIDYVLASECMLPYVSHFHVEMFDPCFSDVHCPIEFNVSTDVPAFNYVPETETSLCSQEKNWFWNTIMWTRSLAKNEFQVVKGKCRLFPKCNLWKQANWVIPATKKCIFKHHTPDIFYFKWVEAVKSTLDNTGFPSIWDAQDIDVAKFKSCFSQRCKDIFQQQWHEEI